MFASIAADCPECRGIRTVFLGVCDVCLAEFDEWHDPRMVGADEDAGEGSWSAIRA